MSLRIDIISNHGRSPQTLIRHSWREGKRVRHKTVANLTQMPPHIVEGIRAIIKGGVVFNRIEDAVSIRRSLPHGHVAVACGIARRLGLRRILDRNQGRLADLALAAILARLVSPASKLATARRLSPDTADSSLGAMLGLGPVNGNEMLDMLDWLHQRQRHIETSLANRHLHGGTLILYDVTSSYVEGQCCKLAAFGHNRDGKKGRKQIVFGLLCGADGCPIAVEVFAGNTADPKTVGSQVARIQGRFGIARVALVGDRGMITTARIREDLKPAGLDWLSALKTQDIRKLLQKGQDDRPAPLRPEELVADAVAEITSPDFPGERLMVCLNPRLREERGHKREALLLATETTLQEIAQSAARAQAGPNNRDWVNGLLGAKANRWKVRKHFDIEVREDCMKFSRNQARIDAEARLDGIYIIRTSLGSDDIDSQQAVEAYKSLSQVERAFRSIKTARLKVRPIFVYSENRVRAHVFLCMLAWYVEWHLRRELAPLLFEDDDREGARAKRTSAVQKAKVSDNARAKADSKLTANGLPVHSFDTLLADLATLTLNEVTLPGQPDSTFLLTADPTRLQEKAFSLLGIKPEKSVYS